MVYWSTVTNDDIMKFASQMGGTRKNHPDRGNLIPERQIWYVFTRKWMLAIK